MTRPRPRRRRRELAVPGLIRMHVDCGFPCRPGHRGYGIRYPDGTVWLLEEAWPYARALLLARCRPGERPWAWWEFEAPPELHGLGSTPGLAARRRAWLEERGLITDDERAQETVRAARRARLARDTSGEPDAAPDPVWVSLEAMTDPKEVDA